MSLTLAQFKEYKKSLEIKRSLSTKVKSYIFTAQSSWRTNYLVRTSIDERIRFRKNIYRLTLNDIELDIFAGLGHYRNLKFLKELSIQGRVVQVKYLQRLDEIFKRHSNVKKMYLDIKQGQYIPLENCFRYKKFKYINVLDVRLYKVEDILIQKINKNISSLNKISKLEIQLNIISDKIESGFINFPKNMYQIKSKIEHFGMQISSNKALNINLIPFFYGCFYLHNLKRFKLQFQSPVASYIDDFQITNLLTAPWYPKLESFILYLPVSSRITDQTLFRIGDRINSFENIKSLQLKFCSSEITDAGLWKLKSIVNLEMLNTLQLGFVGCNGISNASYKSHLFESIGKLINLKTLTLNFMNSTISEKSLKALSSCFKGSKIENFNLCLRNCVDLDHHLNFFSEIRIKSLKSFSFDGSMSKITLKKLGGFINSLIILDELNLILLHCNLADCDFIDLFESFSKVSRLKKFTIILDDNSITNVTIYSLVEGLMHMKQLNEICISLKNCKMLTFEGMRELATIFQKILMLQVLKLNFSNCGCVDDLTMQIYQEIICKLKDLERLEISLDQCRLINTQAIVELSKALVGLKKLKQIDIKANKTRSTIVRVENLENPIHMYP